MRDINFKLTVILALLLALLQPPLKLYSADGIELTARRLPPLPSVSGTDLPGAAISVSAAGDVLMAPEPKPGTRAYYYQMGCDNTSTPSLANLREQTAERAKFVALAASGKLLATPKPGPRKFVRYDTLVTVVPYSQADGTTTNVLEVPATLFSSYHAIPLDRRSGERDFVPEDSNMTINPYSDQYHFLTTGRHYTTYTTTTIPKTWIKIVPSEPKPKPDYKRTASTSTGTTGTPPKYPRLATPPSRPTAPNRRHEKATAANVTARLVEFKQRPLLYQRRPPFINNANTTKFMTYDWYEHHAPQPPRTRKI